MGRVKKKARSAAEKRSDKSGKQGETKPHEKKAKPRVEKRPKRRPPKSDDVSGDGPFTLTIDIGGTGIKMLALDSAGSPASKQLRKLTPKPSHPAQVLATIEAMFLAQPACDRVSVGFPGVVIRGLVKTAPNLDTDAWRGFDLQRAIAAISGRPTRVINDADLLGFGVISGRGVELVLTLGTGLGSGLYSDGHLVPNLELGHHPFKKGQTYEQRVCDAEAKRIAKARFRRRVDEMIAQLEPILNYERLFLGGGNARHLDANSLPDNVELFESVAGMQGGVRLWSNILPQG